MCTHIKWQLYILLGDQNGRFAVSPSKPDFEKYVWIMAIEERDHAVTSQYSPSDFRNYVASKSFEVQSFTYKRARLRCFVKSNLELINEVISKRHGNKQPRLLFSSNPKLDNVALGLGSRANRRSRYCDIRGSTLIALLKAKLPEMLMENGIE